MNAGLDPRARIDALLEERARMIARPLAPAAQQHTFNAVCFTFGEERYAIDIAMVRRIARLPVVTPLPGAPRHFTGVANLRGRLVPIVDLALLLGGSGGHDVDHVVAIGHTAEDIGILASAVTGIEALPVEGNSTGNGRPRTRSIVGRVLADGRALIDGAVLLADPRLTAGATGGGHDHKEPIE